MKDREKFHDRNKWLKGKKKNNLTSVPAEEQITSSFFSFVCLGFFCLFVHFIFLPHLTQGSDK
jgi:hypothetical protein